MFLTRLSVSARFLLVVAIGFIFQAGVSVASLMDLKNSLMQDRISEVKNLLDVGYSTVALYYDQQLKIDRSFVRDVLTDADDAAIAKTIVALAQTLGLEVIAEGIETSEQRLFLASTGCHYHQGFLFSRPLPVQHFERFAWDGEPRPLLEATG